MINPGDQNSHGCSDEIRFKGSGGRDGDMAGCNPSVSGAVESKWSPLRNLEMRIIREWESAGSAEGTVLRAFTPWLIAKMCRFKFSPERPLRS
jgi:hypothetical protein